METITVRGTVNKNDDLEWGLLQPHGEPARREMVALIAIGYNSMHSR